MGNGRRTCEIRALDMLAIEARLLGILCRCACSGRLRDEIFASLAVHHFQSVNHQAVFECLRELGRENEVRIRELLPAKLAQAGFPDVEVTPFFRYEKIGGAEAASLLSRLAAIR